MLEGRDIFSLTDFHKKCENMSERCRGKIEKLDITDTPAIKSAPKKLKAEAIYQKKGGKPIVMLRRLHLGFYIY